MMNKVQAVQEGFALTLQLSFSGVNVLLAQALIDG